MAWNATSLIRQLSLDPAAFETWSTSSDGKAFLRGCGEAWGAAHIA